MAESEIDGKPLKPGDITEDGYLFLGGDPKKETSWTRAPAWRKALRSAAKTGLEAIQPSAIGQGMRKGFVAGAGMIADAPQNVRDLALAGLSVARHKIHGEPLVDIDPQRKASTYLSEATRPAWEYQPQGRMDQAAYTAGEIGAAGLMGGGAGTAKGLMYNVALPVVGGTVGEQLMGEKGKLIGSIAAPIGAGAVEAGVRTALRAGGSPGAVQALEQAGVRPVAGDIGPVAATVQRGLEMTPLGYVVGKSVAAKRQAQIEDAIKQASPHGMTGAVEAGKTIKQGLTDWTNRFETNYQMLRQNTRSLLPDTDQIRVTNTERVLNQLANPSPAIAAAMSPGDLAYFQKMAQAFQSGVLSAGDVRKIKTLVGDKAYPKTKLIGDFDKASYERIWAALAQDMEAAARTKGPNVLKAQQTENAYYKAGRERVREYFDDITKEADPNKLFESLYSGGKRGAEELRTVMKSLRPEERDLVASAVMTRLGKATGSSVDDFSAETFLTNWRNLTPEAKKAMFSGTSNKNLPKALDQIAEAAMVMRQTSRHLPNPSGTAAAGIAGLSLAGAFSNFTGTIASIGGTGALEVLFTRPWFVKWLETGAALPESAMKSHIVRFAVLAERDPVLSEYAPEINASLPKDESRRELSPQQVEQFYRSVNTPRGAR